MGNKNPDPVLFIPAGRKGKRIFEKVKTVEEILFLRKSLVRILNNKNQ